MNEIVVYHGGTEIVKKPICTFGRPKLDFGQGFYVTDLREQAVAWAKLVADRRGKPPILSRYLLNREAVLQEAKHKIFKAYDSEWLKFIVANRLGQNASSGYDYIEGGMANDRVIDTINLYITGLIDEATTLTRLSEHRPNNQMCLLDQIITDKYLIFNGTEQI